MKEKNRCRGSYRLGTACGTCDRCKEKNYTPAKAKLAQAEYEERVKKMPANRVKPKGQVTIKSDTTA